MTDPTSLKWLSRGTLDTYGEPLARVLHACVLDGASVGFVTPYELDDSLAFWTDNVFPAVNSGSTYLLIAERNAQIVGTVQLVCGTVPNQRHRADVSKLLVDPDCRRHGIAKSLMKMLEAKAVEENRSLLTLDTISASNAEGLYLSLGFIKAGEIPDYARAPLENRLEPTTLMYKHI